jgi:hypothetical protein
MDVKLAPNKQQDMNHEPFSSNRRGNLDVLPDFFDLFGVKNAGMFLGLLRFSRDKNLVGFGELKFQIKKGMRGEVD